MPPDYCKNSTGIPAARGEAAQRATLSQSTRGEEQTAPTAERSAVAAVHTSTS